MSRRPFLVYFPPMDAVEEITRPILWNIDPLTKTAMYLLSVAAFAAMGYGFWRGRRRGRLAWKPASAADAANDAKRLPPARRPIGPVRRPRSRHDWCGMSSCKYALPAFLGPG